MSDSQQVVLITGVTGQDGSYLAERLVAEGHQRAQFVTAHHLVVAAHPRGHYRQAAGHGFEEHVGPAFVARGQNEQIGG